MTRDWKEVEAVNEDGSTIWDRSNPLEGEYLQCESNIGPNKSKLYTVKTESGEEVKAWGSTVLDDKLMGVPIGTFVKIEYEGKLKGKKGNEYHGYKVFFDEATKPQEQGGDGIDLDKPVDLKEIPF